MTHAVTTTIRSARNALIVISLPARPNVSIGLPSTPWLERSHEIREHNRVRYASKIRFLISGDQMLHGWDNFFIVAAQASATLIGLLFVAVTLGVGLSTPHGLDATRAFLTPTLIRFSGALFQSMAVLPPWSSAWPAGVILGLLGLNGLAYQIHVDFMQRKIDFAS